jgi:hypothetical protein
MRSDMRCRDAADAVADEVLLLVATPALDI